MRRLLNILAMVALLAHASGALSLVHRAVEHCAIPVACVGCPSQVSDHPASHNPTDDNGPSHSKDCKICQYLATSVWSHTPFVTFNSCTTYVAIVESLPSQCVIVADPTPRRSRAPPVSA